MQKFKVEYIWLDGYKPEPKEIDTINPRYCATAESRSVNFEIKNYDIDKPRNLAKSVTVE